MLLFLVVVATVLVAAWFHLRARDRARTDALLAGADAGLRSTALRFGFRARGECHPIDLIEDQRLLVGLVAVAFAGLDGPARPEALARISAGLARTYLVTLDESDEMLRYVAWLAGRGGDPLGALSRATRRLYRLSALGELDTLMALVEAGVEGKLSPRQMAALEEVKAALRI